MRIVWKGNFDLSGFGRAACDYVSALKKLGVDIRIVNTSQKHLKLIDLPINTEQLEILSHKNNDILVKHAPPSDLFPESAQVNIGYTAFESPKLKDRWLENIRKMDAIIVPTKWCQNILAESEINSYVVPHIVNYTSLDPHRIKPISIRNKRAFAFLAIIDFTYRKGWDLLLDAYWTEFRPDEDVSLILKTYHRSFSKEDREKIRLHIKRPAQIPHTLFYDWPLHDRYLPSLYKACDAYVFPTRGEGFSLTCAEAMSLELPVIATHYGGHTDYMDYSNSTLVKYAGFDILTKNQLDLSPQYEELPLVQPSLPHLKDMMRNVYVHYEEALAKAKKGRQDISKFGDINIGVMLLDTIEKIAHS